MFTLVSRKTGTRFTYDVNASEDGLVFVARLRGPDNTQDYNISAASPRTCSGRAPGAERVVIIKGCARPERLTVLRRRSSTTIAYRSSSRSGTRAVAAAAGAADGARASHPASAQIVRRL